jgi:hypothetical protein
VTSFHNGFLDLDGPRINQLRLVVNPLLRPNAAKFCKFERTGSCAKQFAVSFCLRFPQLMDLKSNSVTIVSGLPRSGTSLLMQMLAAGGMPALTDNLRPPDEDNPRGYLEFEPVKTIKTSSAWLEEARGKAVKMVHLLLLDLPASYTFRVLLMKRNIGEVLASQRAMLRRQGKTGAALSDEQLGQLFLAQMARVENWVKSQPNFSLRKVDFNELVKNPAPQIAAINEFLGGNLDATAMLRVVEPALYRQRS